MPLLSQSADPIHALVIGASGAIGHGLCRQLLACDTVAHLSAVSRGPAPADLAADRRVSAISADLLDEPTLAQLAQSLAPTPVQLVIVASGLLHDPQRQIAPEKALSQLDASAFEAVMAINCLGPLLAAKHLLPLVDRDRPAVFAALSARVGSISDNRLGGWYSYRASKAALNMLLKTLSLEMQRRKPQLVVCGLHPGTVDSALSQPFQQRVAADKLFSPDYAAERLLAVIDQLTPADSGKVLAWDGREVPP